MKSQDMEIFELSTPHHVEYLELDPDSAGAGEWRGGYGTRTRFRFLGQGVRGSTLGDDSAAEGAVPAQGLFGGHDGGLNTLRLTLPDGKRRATGAPRRRSRSPRARSATRSTAAAPATATRWRATRGSWSTRSARGC